MQETSQQLAFHEAVMESNNNVALLARAGCGKTTTIMGSVQRIYNRQPGHESLICAYNKAIADEMSDKLKQRNIPWRSAQASTLHSLGYGLLKYAYGCTINEKKVWEIAEKLDPVDKPVEMLALQLVSHAKAAGFGYFQELNVDNYKPWKQMAEHFALDAYDEESAMDEAITRAMVLYKHSCMDTSVIDFDDMVLLPLLYGMRVRFKKDFVFIDEAQDLSAVRQALAKKFVKSNGKLIIVGDDRQAIYGFSGADSNAMHNLIADSKAVVMPLSVTWRCPSAVVREAQRYVPDIQAAESAVEGAVSNIEVLPERLGPEDAILCRNTAPLIKLAYSLLAKGVPCKVEGRAIGEGLMKLAKRWRVKHVAALEKKLDEHVERERAKADKKKEGASERIQQSVDYRFEQLMDQVSALRCICQSCMSRNLVSVEDVHRAIHQMFDDNPAGVLTLCTYHRSKGREWQRVILLQHNDYCPSRAARARWQLEQEDNLAYVAITRAQKELLYFYPVEEKEEEKQSSAGAVEQAQDVGASV